MTSEELDDEPLDIQPIKRFPCVIVSKQRHDSLVESEAENVLLKDQIATFRQGVTAILRIAELHDYVGIADLCDSLLYDPQRRVKRKRLPFKAED